MDNTTIYDAFSDMTISELRNAYGKSDGAVRKGIERMLKELGDTTLRYRNEKGEFTIKAKGVEWLDNYFVKPNEIAADPIVIKMEERIKSLEALLEAERNSKQELKETMQEAFKAQLSLVNENHEQKLLLAEKTAQNERETLKNEIARLKNRNLLQRILNK